MIEKDFSLKHSQQLEVKCTLRIPQGKGLLRLVIVAPGFLGFKDWGFFPFLCQSLCQSGFATLSFNHALCGVKENPFEITDPQGFAKNSTTQELRDWDLLLDSILTGNFPHANRIRLNAFGIVGHSRGGSYGILHSSRITQIYTVVTWGAIGTFQRFDPETQRRWRREGFIEFGNQNELTRLRLNVTALDALERNYDQLNVCRAMRGLSIPVLLLHGREDKAVPLEEGRRLWDCADRSLSRFRIIENAGHTFRTPHPFTSPSQSLREAISETITWIERKLP